MGWHKLRGVVFLLDAFAVVAHKTTEAHLPNTRHCIPALKTTPLSSEDNTTFVYGNSPPKENEQEQSV